MTREPRCHKVFLFGIIKRHLESGAVRGLSLVPPRSVTPGGVSHGGELGSQRGTHPGPAAQRRVSKEHLTT